MKFLVENGRNQSAQMCVREVLATRPCGERDPAILDSRYDTGPRPRMRARTCSIKAEQGFTILDHVFALLILSVALLGLIALASTVIGTNASSKTRTEALTLVQDKLEDMRRVGYDYALFTNTTVTEAYGSIAGTPSYKRVTTVLPNTPAPGLQTITVTVYWAADTRSLSSSVLQGR